jgi:hypothetical protein
MGKSMDRRPVNSSYIRSIGYDRERAVLEIEYVNSTLFRYYQVPHRIYRDLMRTRNEEHYIRTYVHLQYWGSPVI